MDDVVTDLRTRVASSDDCGTRGVIEDRLALLIDYRLAGMDEARFEKLLSTLRAGRSPARLRDETPESIGGELTRRWQAYAAETALMQGTEKWTVRETRDERSSVGQELAMAVDGVSASRGGRNAVAMILHVTQANEDHRSAIFEGPSRDVDVAVRNTTSRTPRGH